MFEWDEAKSAANMRSRGFDFAYAAQVFNSPMLEIGDERIDYGEARIQVIGCVGQDVLFVVYTWRAGNRRIISARQASRRERNAYREILG